MIAKLKISVALDLFLAHDLVTRLLEKLLLIEIVIVLDDMIAEVLRATGDH